jgi:allantoin racemase
MAESSRPEKLWYQSFVHPIEQAPYIERLQSALDAAAGPGIRFEVHGLDPPDHLFHPLTEFRCAAQTIRNALEAERAGYDAFVIGHFQEPGLLEIRGALDIPVIGLGEANLLAALSMGRRLGLVTIDPVFIEWHERQVHAHGLDQRVAGVRAIKMDLPAFMRAFTNEECYVAVRADFVEQVRPLVAAGAEVIIPAGASAPSSSTERWCSTALRSRRKPPRWRSRCAASLERWSAGAAPTPRLL